MRKLLAVLLSLSLLLTLSIPSVSASTTQRDVRLGIEAVEYTSCPYLFTFNGMDYSLENDIISVARTPMNEYKDYLFINNSVKPYDGKIKMKIVEPSGEFSRLTLLGLGQISHPEGTKAGIDEKGNIHTYTNTTAPISVETTQGNVIDKVSADDNQGISLYDSEGIVFSFPSLDLSSGAKFILKVDGFERNELLSDALVPKVPAIEIQTEENGQWITRNSFFPKAEAAYGVYDLKEYLNPENPKIRLLSKSCRENVSHLIDYVALDNSKDQYSLTMLPLSKAVKNGNEDVIDTVTNDDDSYVQLNGGQDTMELEFDSIETKDTVDYFFVSKGYYQAVGNTFYISTKDSSGNWQTRWSSSWYGFQNSTGGDITREVDLSYLQLDMTDPDLEIKITNKMGWNPQVFALIDYTYLKVDGNIYKISSAIDEATGQDIYKQLRSSDDYKWNIMNKSVIVKFEDLSFPTRVPVVLIPGVMGTDLYGSDGKHLWISIWDKTLRRLAADENGVPTEDGIEPRSINEDAYGEMSEALSAAGFDVREFPYDWRLSNETNAENLKKFIDKITEESGVDKVDIVAHSMGGILTKTYISQNLYNTKIRKFITIGTPHFGAPKMTAVWKTGDLDPGVFFSKANLAIDADVIREIAPNFGSIYELFPSKKFFNYYPDGYYSEGFDTNGDGVASGDITTYDDMYDWYVGRGKNIGDINTSLLNNADDLHDVIDYLDIVESSQVDGYMICSDSESTILSIADKTGFLGRKIKNVFTELEEGDGTVPTLSATAGHTVHPKVYYADAGGHGDLFKEQPIIDKTINILNGESNKDVEGIRDELAPLSGYYIMAACPVDLKVTDSSGNTADPVSGSTDNIQYSVIDETKQAFVKDTSFRMELDGKGDGISDVVIKKYVEGEIVEELLYYGIPVQDGSKATLDISSPDSPKAVALDLNGDGNVEKQISPNYVLTGDLVKDETPPVVTTDAPNGIFNHDLYVNINASDESGIDKVYYSINGNPAETYSSPLEFTQDGNVSLVITAVDNAGNWTESKNINFTIDKTMPLISSSITNNEQINRIGTKVLTFDATDNLTGVTQLSAELDGQPIQSNTKIELEKMSFGLHTLTIKAADGAGNINIMRTSFTVTADKSVVISLLDRYYSQGAIDNQGIYKSLKTKVEKENYKPFINELNAQSGKHIKAEAAANLIQYAKWISEKGW